MIERPKLITRGMVKRHRDKIFVFGDNLARLGMGGQAGAMRHEPNAIGVATKRAPSMAEEAFFADRDDEIAAVVRDLMNVSIAAFKDRRTIVIPFDGLGTGLAELPTRSPKIFAMLQQYIWALTVM